MVSASICLSMINEYHITVLCIVGIWVISALGLNIIVGYGGLFHVGAAVAVGVGAYSSALLTKSLGLSFWSSLPLSLLVCLIFGAITGLPALRVKDDFLAIVTLGMNFVFQSILIYLPYFGGARGIGNIPRPTIFGTAVSKTGYLSLIILFVVISAIFSRRIWKSWLGLGLMSIRENEIPSKTIGININFFKVIAFSLGSAICGLSGVLYAHFVTHIDPYEFGFFMSVFILTMIVFGGIGTIRGSIFGAIFLGASPEIFRFVQEYRELIYGGMLLVMMRFQPNGLLSEENLNFLKKRVVGFLKYK